MAIKIFQFLSIVLTALCLVPSGAHLLELPNKMQLDGSDYQTVQQLYRGWALAGIVLVGAILSGGIHAYLVRTQPLPLLLALAGFLLLAATLASFLIFILPVNQATTDWAALPENWRELRTRWEYAHASNGMITFFALVTTVLSALSWRY